MSIGSSSSGGRDGAGGFLSFWLLLRPSCELGTDLLSPVKMEAVLAMLKGSSLNIWETLKLQKKALMGFECLRGGEGEGNQDHSVDI